MVSRKQERLNLHAQERGFRNYYEERTLARKIGLGDRLSSRSFHDVLENKGLERNKESMLKYQQIRERLHANVPGDGVRQVHYQGRTMSWDQFMVKSKIAKNTRKVQRAARFHPGYENFQDDDYLSIFFEEYWDEYEFG